MQHLFGGMPLVCFALRLAEGQGQVGVACGTDEEQVGLTRGSWLDEHLAELCDFPSPREKQ